MSERLWHLLSGKLDEIATFYKVRPRITLIVRVPGKPKEGVFLSDDNWSDAVATVKYLSGDGGTFAAGPPEPPAEVQPAPALPNEVREAAERVSEMLDRSAHVKERRRMGSYCLCFWCWTARLMDAIAARKGGA